MLLKAQGHGNKSGGGSKTNRNKSRSNTIGLCAATTNKSHGEGTVALANGTQISQEVWYGEPAYLNSGPLWDKFILFGVSLLTLLKILSSSFFVATERPSSLVTCITLSIPEV